MAQTPWRVFRQLWDRADRPESRLLFGFLLVPIIAFGAALSAAERSGRLCYFVKEGRLVCALPESIGSSRPRTDDVALRIDSNTDEIPAERISTFAEEGGKLAIALVIKNCKGESPGWVDELRHLFPGIRRLPHSFCNRANHASMNGKTLARALTEARQNLLDTVPHDREELAIKWRILLVALESTDIPTSDVQGAASQASGWTPPIPINVITGRGKQEQRLGLGTISQNSGGTVLNGEWKSPSVAVKESIDRLEQTPVAVFAVSTYADNQMHRFSLRIDGSWHGPYSTRIPVISQGPATTPPPGNPSPAARTESKGQAAPIQPPLPVPEAAPTGAPSPEPNITTADPGASSSAQESKHRPAETSQAPTAGPSPAEPAAKQEPNGGTTEPEPMATPHTTPSMTATGAPPSTPQASPPPSRGSSSERTPSLWRELRPQDRRLLIGLLALTILVFAPILVGHLKRRRALRARLRRQALGTAGQADRPDNHPRSSKTIVNPHARPPDLIPARHRGTPASPSPRRTLIGLPRLALERRNRPPKPIPLTPTLLVGSGPASTVTWEGDPLLEPAHARIDWDGSRLLITDTSVGGTFVNGTRLGRRVTTALKGGDRIRIGSSDVTVEW